ncbi:MAG: hypothetical protein ACSHX6_04585 [Akkermansiaceae bacterium]
MNEFINEYQREGFFIPFIVAIFQDSLGDAYDYGTKKETESDQSIV